MLKRLIKQPAFAISAALCLSFLTPLAPKAEAQQISRLKDIISIEGIRDNQLVGYGLVVGLNGTGDTLRNAPFTEQSLAAMLERLGVNTKGVTMRVDNVAAVSVTATLAPFARRGTRLDVSVSSLGDAEDLRGGTLLATSLLGADGEVYAVAQGSVAVAGFSAQGDSAGVTQGVPTSGRVANGAIVERELPFELSDLKTVKLSLHNPDLTTAKRVSQAINSHLGHALARPIDPGTVQLDRPVGYQMALVDLLTEIEKLEIEPDQHARVVIDERTGIIVMGANVRISAVAIAQANLTIRITESPIASQPSPLAQGGDTAILGRTDIDIDDGSARRLGLLPQSTTLQDLVDGLNALGVGPRDMITILQAIKASGAMQAELEVL